MGSVIRKAHSGEADQIVALYEWLFAPPGGRPPRWNPDAARERADEAISSPDAEVLLAEEDGAVIGFCTAYLDLNSVRFGQRCWVEDLAVDPSHRSRGVGAALLNEAKEWARSRGASHLELDSALARVDAHRFYEREGATQSYSFGWEL